jgi:hypothetical protein
MRKNEEKETNDDLQKSIELFIDLAIEMENGNGDTSYADELRDDMEAAMKSLTKEQVEFVERTSAKLYELTDACKSKLVHKSFLARKEL